MRSHAKAPSAGSIGIGHRLGLLALALIAFLVMSAPAAMAAPTAQPGYGFLNSFGGGELSGFFGGAFTPPRNPIVVDSHGNIVVADELGHSVAVFAPDAMVGGTFLTRTEIPDGYPRDLAIDLTTDALYVQEPIFGTINRYLSDGNSPPAYTIDPSFSVPAGGVASGGGSQPSIAVDPTTHDLLLTDPAAEAIKRYDQSGALLASISIPSMPFPGWTTVAADGSIYAGEYHTDIVTHFSGSGVLLGEPINVGAEPTALALDPVTGNLVVAIGGRLKVYSAAGALLSEAPAGRTSGTAFDTSGRLYAYDLSDVVKTYVPAIYPGADAPVVSNIATRSVHVSAEVDPGSGPLAAGSSAHFEYRPVSAGDGDWKPTPDQALSVPVTVEADIEGLSPNVAYLVRFVAKNSLSSHTTEAKPFTTAGIAPETETAAATDVSETSAVLNGTVNPTGLQSTYHFEYGLTDAYGSRIPLGIDAVAGSGRANRIFSRTITGLAPGTTYHYRLVSQNVIGVGQGVDHTFTTTAVGGVPHRAFEQVTPVDKHGIPVWEIGIQAKAGGSAIVYASQGASTSSPSYAMSMGLRDGADWSGGIDLDPPLNPPGGIIVGVTTLAVSADFTHTLVATNRKLTPDAVEDGPGRVNLYVVDVATSAHTLVGTAPSGLAEFIGNGSGNQFFAAAPDFSWIVFMSNPPLLPEAPEGALYRWSEVEDLEVVSVLPDGNSATVALGSISQPVVRSVSADGSRIYFNVDGGSEVGIFLREGDQTKAISVSRISGDPVTPRPGRLIGTSKDGRYLFFACTEGKLTSDAPGASGTHGDVYRYDDADDSLEYLGAAAINDGFFFAPAGVGDDGQTAYWRDTDKSLVWRDGVVRTVVPTRLSLQAFMSPNGRYLVYEEGLEPDVDPLVADSKIYLYDSETDQRSCISCQSDGSPAYGRLPSSYRFVSNRLPQAVTDSGEAFFTSSARLVAADVNGSSDVYEYKDGKNRLISPGNAPFKALFSDISEDGSDVFFTTNQKLVGQDNDESVDLYDARIDGGLAKQNPPPPQECIRDDCKATPDAGPELPFGGSEALSGPGNVSGEARKRCAKGAHARKVKGKTRCVKQSKAKKKAKKAKNAKRANTNRRQGR